MHTTLDFPSIRAPAILRGSGGSRVDHDLLARSERSNPSVTMAFLGDHLKLVDGSLHIEDVPVGDLVSRYGTPLHVISESQLRTNYRRFMSAFGSAWQASDITLYYSIKANPALAIRHVLSTEGAGGDCNGLNELRLALLGGVDPGRVNLNGNNKTHESIDLAVEVGARINVDSSEEFALVVDAARRHHKRARIGLRIKPDLREFGTRESEVRAPGTLIREYGNMHKWGLPIAIASSLVRRASTTQAVELQGVHYHLGRQIGGPSVFELMLPGVFRFIASVKRSTGWVPSSINLGGGFTQGRDPFGRARRRGGQWPLPSEQGSAPVEEWADVIVKAIIQELDRHGLAPPALEFECGRFLVANAGTTLTCVGVVKTIARRIWVNVDASVNQIGMARAPWNAHAVVPAMPSRGATEKRCDVVGPLCTLDVLAHQVKMPVPHRGDCLAILDTGAYADAEASVANAFPRPAVVLVKGRESDLIRRRETFEDLTRRDQVPRRLLAQPPHRRARAETPRQRQAATADNQRRSDAPTSVPARPAKPRADRGASRRSRLGALKSKQGEGEAG